MKKKSKYIKKIILPNETPVKYGACVVSILKAGLFTLRAEHSFLCK